MFQISYEQQYSNNSSAAHTLSPDEVCLDHGELEGYSSCTHDDGWTISGCIVSDYYFWVHQFEATHPDFGRVWGDFETVVYADSEEGFRHFYDRHTPESWDYGDI